jgi:hypothetical protein
MAEIGYQNNATSKISRFASPAVHRFLCTFSSPKERKKREIAVNN